MVRPKAKLAFMLPLTSEEAPALVESPVVPVCEQESQSPSASESDEPSFDPEIFEKLLQHECHRWQQKLRLQDWNVKVVLCRLNEMPDRDCLAAITPTMERKDALMKVLTPLDVQLIDGYLQNEEGVNYGLTIVHELIHLHLWPFCQNQTPTELVAEEQAVNALSRCIVAAYSGKIKPLTPAAVAPIVGHYL